MPKLASLKTCTGCMLCMNVCPRKAISMRERDGFYYPVIDEHNCVECNLCEQYCPIVSKKKRFMLDNEDTTPFSVKSKIPERRLLSASGGFFMELAMYLFEKYGARCYVVGAIIDGLKVRHTIIHKKEDLYLLQGTKYLQSNMNFIYISIYQLLKKGAFVLFTGLPCQVYALKTYLYNKQYSGEIVTCDLICNGVPSYKLLKIDIKNNMRDITRIVSFRDKIEGWDKCLAFTYENSSKQIIRLSEENSFFLKSFKVNYALRNCCYVCQYCHISRISDFTIGDFWGGDFSIEDKKQGVSLVLCHNEKFMKTLLEIPTIDIEKVKWKDCLCYNPRIYCGRRFIQWVIPRSILKYIWKSNYNIQNQLLTNELGIISHKRFYWAILKFWQIIVLKIEMYYRTLKLHKILNLINES